MSTHFRVKIIRWRTCKVTCCQ